MNVEKAIEEFEDWQQFLENKQHIEACSLANFQKKQRDVLARGLKTAIETNSREEVSIHKLSLKELLKNQAKARQELAKSHLQQVKLLDDHLMARIEKSLDLPQAEDQPHRLLTALIVRPWDLYSHDLQRDDDIEQFLRNSHGSAEEVYFLLNELLNATESKDPDVVEKACNWLAIIVEQSDKSFLTTILGVTDLTNALCLPSEKARTVLKVLSKGNFHCNHDFLERLIRNYKKNDFVLSNLIQYGLKRVFKNNERWTLNLFNTDQWRTNIKHSKNNDTGKPVQLVYCFKKLEDVRKQIHNILYYDGPYRDSQVEAEAPGDSEDEDCELVNSAMQNMRVVPIEDLSELGSPPGDSRGEAEVDDWEKENMEDRKDESSKPLL